MVIMLFFLFACFLALSLGLASGSFSRQVTINGVSGSESVTVTGESSILGNPTVLAAQAGTLTTRTSGTAGTLTMGASHGIITGQRIDLYWSGGKAHTAVVGTVAGTSVPFTAAVGDALPIATTAITVGIPNDCVFNCVGDNIQGIIAATGSSSGYIIFATSSADLLVEYVTPTTPFMYKNTDPGTNPLAGVTVAKVWFSHSSTTGSATDMKAAAVVA